MPNALNFGFAALGAFLHLGEHGPDGLVLSVGGWLIALVVVFVPFLLRVYRGGDAKLVMAIAAWLGPRGGLNAFVFGVVLGGVVAVFTALLNRRMLAQPVAERPDQAHAPMAVAFALGAVAALQWPLEAL